jgi:hypothetical protein
VRFYGLEAIWDASGPIGTQETLGYGTRSAESKPLAALTARGFRPLVLNRPEAQWNVGL